MVRRINEKSEISRRGVKTILIKTKLQHFAFAEHPAGKAKANNAEKHGARDGSITINGLDSSNVISLECPKRTAIVRPHHGTELG